MKALVDAATEEAATPVVEEVVTQVVTQVVAEESVGDFFLSPTVDVEKNIEDFAKLIENGEILLPDSEGNINVKEYSGLVLLIKGLPVSSNGL